ncbi:MAG: hypothetical protein M3R08_01630 [Bacteroidota bacterium]|nr:hypothetical protein [Bacteroidota bacterium]
MSTILFLRRLLLVIAVPFGAVAVLAQDHPFYVYGEIWDLDTKQILINCTVLAVNVDDTTTVLKGRIDGKGRYELELPFDQSYKVQFIAPGYVTKHVLMDLNGVTVDRRNGDLGMNIQAALFKPLENIDYTLITSKPYGICRLNKKGKSFEWDEEYTTANSGGLQAVMDLHTQRSKEIGP